MWAHGKMGAGQVELAKHEQATPSIVTYGVPGPSTRFKVTPQKAVAAATQAITEATDVLDALVANPKQMAVYKRKVAAAQAEVDMATTHRDQLAAQRHPMQQWLLKNFVWTQGMWLCLECLLVALGLHDVFLVNDGAGVACRNNSVALAALMGVVAGAAQAHLLVRVPPYLLAALQKWPGTTISAAWASVFVPVTNFVYQDPAKKNENEKEKEKG